MVELGKVDDLEREADEAREALRKAGVATWPLGENIAAVVKLARELTAKVEWLERVAAEHNERSEEESLDAIAILGIVRVLRERGFRIEEQAPIAAPIAEMAVPPPTEPPPVRFELPIDAGLVIDGGPYDGRRAWVVAHNESLGVYEVKLYGENVEVGGYPRVDVNRILVLWNEASSPCRVRITAGAHVGKEATVVQAKRGGKYRVALPNKREDDVFGTDVEVIEGTLPVYVSKKASEPAKEGT